MAPEYAVLGHLSVKVDVYSFGILVLEIVTGRRNTDVFDADEESSNLLSYVRPIDQLFYDFLKAMAFFMLKVLINLRTKPCDVSGMGSLAERDTTGDH